MLTRRAQVARSRLVASVDRDRRPPVYIRAMKGLGDTIYQRAFVRALAKTHKVYLRNPWPELFEDVPSVFMVRDKTHLRTQAKNLVRNRRRMWFGRPANAPERRIWYGISNPYQGIIPDMASAFGVAFQSQFFDLPGTDPCPVRVGKPLAVIRPVTVRNEWANPARNCKPEYIHHAVQILRERFHVVSVADVVENGEWFDGDPPAADAVFHRGELHIKSLLALIRHAAVVVGPVGWITPATMAMRKPAIMIAGGQGAWNAPELLSHPSLQTPMVKWLMPDNYCRCAPAWHECDKTISNFPDQFRAALREIV